MSKIPSAERVTITLPADLLREIDRLEKNRSKFVLGAIQRELQSRRREALHHSLRHPHPESDSFADLGFETWGTDLPEGEAESLVDMAAGTAVQWVPGQGWSEP